MKQLRLINVVLFFVVLFLGTAAANAQIEQSPAKQAGNLPGKEAVLAPRIETVEELPCGFKLESIIIERRGFIAVISEHNVNRFLYLIPADNVELKPHPDSWLPCRAALEEIIRLISPPDSPWQWDELPEGRKASEERNPCKDAVWSVFHKTKDWPAGWKPLKSECKLDAAVLSFQNSDSSNFELKLKRNSPSPWIKSSFFSLATPPPQLKSPSEAEQLKRALENFYSFSSGEGNRFEGSLPDSMPFSTPSDWIGTLVDGVNYRIFGVHPGIVLMLLTLFFVFAAALTVLHFPWKRTSVSSGLALLLLALGIRAAFGLFGPCNFRSDIYGGDMQHIFNFGTAYPAFQAVLFYLFGRSLHVIYWSNAILNALTSLLAVWWLLSLKVKESVAWTTGILIAIAPAYVWVGTSDAHQNMTAFMLLWLLLANTYICKGKNSILWLPLVPLATWLIVVWRPEAIIFPALSLIPALLAGLQNERGKPYLRWMFISLSILAITAWGLSIHSEQVSAGAVNINPSLLALLWPRYGWISPAAGLPLSMLLFLGIFSALKHDKTKALFFIMLCIGVLLPFSSMIWSPITPRDRIVFRYFMAAMPFFMFFAAYGIDTFAQLIDDLAAKFMPRLGKHAVSALITGLILILSVPDFDYDLSIHDEIRSLEKTIDRIDPACPLYFINVDGVFGALAPPYYLPWIFDKNIKIRSELPRNEDECLYYWKPPLCDLPPDTRTANDQKAEWVAPVWEVCDKWRSMKNLKLLEDFDSTGTVSGFADHVPGLKAGLYFRNSSDRKTTNE